MPHPFIVPGGRFREFYYWYAAEEEASGEMEQEANGEVEVEAGGVFTQCRDTYWVINGLLVCDMHSTAKGMIENLLQMVRSRARTGERKKHHFARRMR